MATRLLVFAFLVALALGAAGCGSDDDKDNDRAATAPVAASTPAETPTAATPASPEIATKPKITVPSSPPPKQLVIKDLRPGSGQAAKAGDTSSAPARSSRAGTGASWA